MKPWLGSLAMVQPQRLWSVAVVGCLLVPLVFFTVLRQSSQSMSIMNFQVSIVQTDGPALLVGDDPSGGSRLPASGRDHVALLVENTTVSSGDEENPTQAAEQASSGDGWSSDGATLLAGQASSSRQASVHHLRLRVEDARNSPPAAEQARSGDGWRGDGSTLLARRASSSQQASNHQLRLPVEEGRSSPPATGGGSRAPSMSGYKSGSQKPETTVQESRIVCDLSQIRTDICDLRGDVRINGSSSFVVLATPSSLETIDVKNSWGIKPYARKWETNTMAHIKEFSVRTAAIEEGTPRCTVNYTVPAVVFSTGGLLGNFFHDMADVLIPLFLTTHHYNGEVQFLITQYRPSWVEKYRAILRRLSRYELINIDTDDRVHCFSQATVGLHSHKELGIDPSLAPVGYSMVDFRRFLRSCLSLKREYPMRRDATKKPRLLFLSRRGSRSLLNERKVFRMARNVGFKVIIAPPEAAKNMSQFAHTVNSCDVLVGVHGAGLTNMVFLPTNATLVQIVPFGELKYPCRFPYGDPAMGMGLTYLEYEVSKEESSLIRQYPKNHPVLKDPLSIHKQGFPAVWSIYIDKQNVTVDVRRFRSVLEEALRPFR